VAVGAAAAVVAAAGGGPFNLGTYDYTVLRHEYFQLWRDVERRVPEDGLVFTTHTGPGESVAEGWNYYPGLAGRQVYLAGWTSSPLRTDRTELAVRLARNASVFEGRVAPRDVPTDRRYAAYYAAAWKTDAVPATFVPVYSNRLYVLYRVPPSRHSRTLVRHWSCASLGACTRLRVPVVVTTA
jgi:hypothetical protein